MVMEEFAALDEIAFGDMTAADAHRVIVPHLTDLTEKRAQRIYTVLRSWLWKALNERRRDEDMREWFNVLRSVSAYFLKRAPMHAERIRVLYELLHESISVPEVMPTEEILQRSHVREILLLLHASRSKSRERSFIGEQLDLKQANLSRVMNLLLSNGLVDRVVSGKSASFKLTVDGLRRAAEIAAESRPQVQRFGRAVVPGDDLHRFIGLGSMRISDPLASDRVSAPEHGLMLDHNLHFPAWLDAGKKYKSLQRRSSDSATLLGHIVPNDPKDETKRQSSRAA